MDHFIDTQSWPLARLHMPAHVNDDRAHELLADFQALYARQEPFALLMDGVELPRHSPRFMTTYVQWSQANFALQQRYCVGAIRIEAEAALRCAYQTKAQQHQRGRTPSPYRYLVVATTHAAEMQARVWLADRANR